MLLPRDCASSCNGRTRVAAAAVDAAAAVAPSAVVAAGDGRTRVAACDGAGDGAGAVVDVVDAVGCRPSK